MVVSSAYQSPAPPSLQRQPACHSPATPILQRLSFSSDYLAFGQAETRLKRKCAGAAKYPLHGRYLVRPWQKLPSRVTTSKSLGANPPDRRVPSRATTLKVRG